MPLIVETFVVYLVTDLTLCYWAVLAGIRCYITAIKALL